MDIASNLVAALELLLVGMLTVFVALLLVVYLGKGIILFVSKYVPESVPAAEGGGREKPVPSNVAAAIASAVSTATAGKGRVVKIERRK